MRYLHGDSSPFPVNENFLETLCAATDTCVALFEADMAVENARAVTESSERAVAAEIQRVERLTRAVTRALGPHGPSEEQGEPATATEAAAVRIGELARGAIEDTRVSIERWRDRTIAAAVAAIPDVTKIVGGFVVKHKLPGTTWSFEWKAEMRGAPGRAVMYSATEVGLNATYEVVLPPGHLWAQAVRGSVIEPRMSIPLMRKGWLGKPRMANERLDRLYVTHVKHNAESTTMTLCTSRREPSPGLEITVRSTVTPGVSVMRIDAAGCPTDERAMLLGDAVDVVQHLWERVESTISDLIFYRKRLLAATLQEAPLARVEKPGAIADAIIESLTPIVAEMLRHSRARGELALKRDLGDGRREEMFISHDEVTKRWQRLPPQYQARFDGFDLEDGRTNVLSKSELAGARPPARSGTPPPLPKRGGGAASEPELLSA
ncbi:MAG TPA: hypothetical protein VHB21_11645 [Minicystis sp.]|nr:hypothetical protein [Minicystis sp.]